MALCPGLIPVIPQQFQQGNPERSNRQPVHDRVRYYGKSPNDESGQLQIKDELQVAQVDDRLTARPVTTCQGPVMMIPVNIHPGDVVPWSPCSLRVSVTAVGVV